MGTDWGLWGHIVDMLVILDMAQVSISHPAAAVYCCAAICLLGPCWLLVIRHQMGCHDPSILPSQALTQRAREVSVTHAITLPVVSIIPRKNTSRGQAVAATNTALRLWMHDVCLHVFFPGEHTVIKPLYPQGFSCMSSGRGHGCSTWWLSAHTGGYCKLKCHYSRISNLQTHLRKNDSPTGVKSEKNLLCVCVLHYSFHSAQMWLPM